MQKLPLILSEILLPFKPKNCFQFGNRKAIWIVLYKGRTRQIWFVPSVRLRKGIPMMDSMWHVNNNIYYYSGPLFMYILTTTTNTKKPYHLDLADLVCLGSGKGTYSRVLNRRQFRIKLKTVWKRMFLYKWPLYDLFWPFFCHMCVSFTKLRFWRSFWAAKWV